MKKKLFSLMVGVIILIQLVVPCSVFGATASPVVTSVTPSGDSVSKVAIGKVEFDKVMDRTTLTSENIVITDEDGLAVAQTESSAYDTEYTFICDFEANTTYTVKVSSNVKSAEGVAVDEYTHTFTTAAIILETTCVSPANDESYFYTGSGAMGKVSNVYGGNAGAYWANNANVSKLWFGVDLGKKYDIAYIAYVPGFPSASAVWGNNINIQVSNDSEFKTYETLALTPVLSECDKSIRYMVANDTDEKYQYVRLYKPGQYMAIADLLVYAYPDAPTVTSVTPSGDSVTKATIGKIEFDTAMDITTLTSANITVTDAEGTVVSQTESSAYDSAYTFICDFEAGATYTVTVSSNVKSSVGINAETYTHTFTTAEELIVAENVSPTNDASYFYEKSGAFGTVSNAYGGNAGKYWANNASVSKVWFGVDLGKAYDIAYISYVPGFPSAGASWGNNINIQVSNDSEFKTYETLALTPTLSAYDGSVRYMVANDTDEKYQYVRLYKAGSYMALSDFLVYAYPGAPTVTSVTPSGDNVSKAAIGKIEFDTAMDITTLTSANITVTDENGVVIEQKETSAYDSAYTFICDFQADTTYTVTVSSNVKSAVGINAETYTHAFTTAEELIVAENVSPANDESYFYEKSGAFGNVSNAYGTTSPPHWANNANVTKVWFGVDLGKAYDIAYIAYVPGFPSASAVWANNINIQVSNDSEFKTYETLALTPTLSAYDGSVRYMVANDTDTKYQYVRLFKTSKNIALADFLVYAYAEAPTIEAITPSGDNVTKASTCKVKFDMAMDRATLTSENIVIKDEDGNVLEQKNVSVYDTEYVFMCDFEANTTYKVTVSTNVKSKAGLFLEAAEEHSFTTGTHAYKTVDITPNTEESISHNASGECTEQLLNVFDKNPATGWNTYGSVKPKWLMFDLGKEVEIAYINYVPGLGNDSVGWASDVSIQVSETEDFANPVTLAVTPSLTTADNYKTVSYTVAPAESGKYRYVRVWENATHISVYELTVYGYEEAIEVKTEAEFEQIYGTENCKINSYAIYGSLTAGEKVSLAVDVTLLSDEVSAPDVYMAVYDGGRLVNISKGKPGLYGISAQIEIPENITNAEVKMFVWADGMNPMLSSIVKEIK